MKQFSYTAIGEELSLEPLKEDLRTLSWAALRADLYAGLSVALVSVPSAMAFSLVAGLPLMCGIFAAIYSAIIASLFGSCRFLIVGPTNVSSLLVQFATATLLQSEYRDLVGAEREMVALEILSTICLLVGFFQAIAAFFRLGRLIQFVSYSVIVGYVAGTAMTLATEQLYTLFGIETLSQPASLLKKLTYLVSHLEETHLPTLFIGLGSLVVLLLLGKNKKIPAGAVVLLISGLVVHFFGMSTYSEWGFFQADDHRVVIIGDTGVLQDIFPRLTFPHFDLALINQLIPVAFAIALLSALETMLVAKSITASSGQNLAVNQELMGLGFANSFAAFIGALPSSASISRSMMVYQNGAKTRFGSIISALFVALFVAVFGYFVQRIPLVALAAILLVLSYKMVSWRQLLLCYKATYADKLVLTTTILSCLILGIDLAFYIGVCLSITLYLKKAAVPHLVECSFDETGQIGSTHAASHQGKTRAEIRVINVTGELFFGAAEIFQNTLKSLTQHDTHVKVIILRLKNARDLDATACLALEQLHQYLKETHRHLLLCGVTYPTWEVLCNSSTMQVLGKENVFILEEKQPKASLQKALVRAKILTERDVEVESGSLIGDALPA